MAAADNDHDMKRYGGVGSLVVIGRRIRRGSAHAPAQPEIQTLFSGVTREQTRPEEIAPVVRCAAMVRVGLP